ncbi:MAG: hypothetical protein B5766_08500 [Candidatus Lumbricidophila eiseniae]|uniref:Peptidoglycan binding-like domain-containing protein n=1 Tax=Candidatus Lumbricidiphila eiseniae TaxID=1969409 RepID=A0A2A6FQ61_9MICO|nr:MAG: hypothetical protein B5766_08500 [Candidatus Lumbricidophila eiseniae]
MNARRNITAPVRLSHESSDEPRTRNSRGARRTVVSIVVVGVLVLGVGLTVAAANGFSFSPPPPPKGPAAASTVAVTRGDLTSTFERSGTLGYARQSTVRAPSGTVTWLPVVGTTVERGGVLARVDEGPIVLLYGELPFYRTLQTDDTGADVQQLEENLAAMGYKGFDVDTKFTAGTATAVKKWQASLGQEKTGIVQTRLVHIAPGPMQVTALSVGVGDPASGAIMTVSSKTRVVTIDLDTTDSNYAIPGKAVKVTMPDNATFDGTITSVSTAVTTSNSQGGGVSGEDSKNTQLRVIITPNDSSAITLAGASTAKAVFVSDSRTGVLIVPITALLALSEGGYAVEVVSESAEGGKSAPPSKLVGVTTGLFSKGKVEISGDGIDEGTKVVVPAS